MLELKEIEQKNKIPKKPVNLKKTANALDPENEDEEKLITPLKTYIEKKSFTWDTTNADDFQFFLPPTVFSEEKKINFEIFEESEIKYDDSYVTRSLTSEQLSEIWNKGQFSVKSLNNRVPYIWQLSEWLHKGRQNINDSFYNDLGLSFYFLYHLKDRFSIDPKKASFSIPFCFIFLYKGFQDLWGLFFGRHRYSRDYYNCLKWPDSYLGPLVFREYQKNLLRDNPEILTSIYYPNFQKHVNKISTDFLTKWNDDKIVIEHEMREQDLPPKEIKEKLADIKFQRLIEELEKSTKLDNKRKRFFIETLKAEKIYSKIKFDYQMNLNNLDEKLKEEIKREYPIKSRAKEWFQKEFEQRRKPEVEKLEEEMNTILENELNVFPVQKLKIMSYVTYLKYKKQNMELEMKNKEKGVLKTFYTQINLLPPYGVKKSEVDYNNQKTTSYSLQKYENIETNTDVSFWKLRLMFTRLYATFINIFVICYFHLWNHSWGLKALCAKEIVNDYEINYQTGVVSPSETSYSYRSALYSLFSSISRSRSSFIRASDKGFLGSKLGNVLNLFEVYVIKLILGGIIAGLLYPLWIILYSTLILCFTFLALIISAIFIPLIQSFKILIYDFDEPDYSKNACFPLAWILLQRFISQGIIHFVLTICTIIAQIFLSIFMILFAFVRWTLRSLYDCCTYLIIRCNGNIPKADTSFAWRISGPGSLRTQFYKLDIEEALLLVRAQLEINQLEDFTEKMNKEIDSPLKIFDDLNCRIMGNLGANLISDNNVYQDVQKFKNVLSSQMNKRRCIYPNVTNNVRFSKEDLELLLEATYDLCREFVPKNQHDFIWKKNNLVPNDWRLLTERILIQVFNSEDILVNVDESELKSDAKQKQSNLEVKQELYDQLGFHKRFEKARAKHAYVESTFSFGGNSSAPFLEEEYYHNARIINRSNKLPAQELDQIVIAPEVDIFINNREHLYIEYENERVVEKERKEADRLEDEKIND